MYSGIADIAALEKDADYLNAITKIWEDIVYKKMYLTGGIGATGGNEGFADPYLLPNMSAYCETCASIGNIFFNHRLFLLHGQSKYIDILEKTLYNSMLSGVSLSADRFFYPNPLESNGQHERSPWFGCACCPSNIARFVPAIPGYVYAATDKELYINLFISNNADLTIGNEKVSVSQKANFPWDGKVEIMINTESRLKFDLKIRIPGWAQNEAIPGGLYKFIDQSTDSVTLLVNGEKLIPVITEGYAVVSRKWKAGDKIEIEFPMEVREVTADNRILEDRDKVAIQRGPLIYCAEWPDNNRGHILNLVLKKDETFTTEYVPSLLGGSQVIKTRGYQTRRTLDEKVEMFGEDEVSLIPYALWNNRGPGQMMVWLPVSSLATIPIPAPTIARNSRIRASKMSDDLLAVNDQIHPLNSNRSSILHYDWLPDTNKLEWIEYDFEKPETISETKVFWYDDSPGGSCRIPDEWEFLYLSGNIWEPVSSKLPYKVTKDGWDSLKFSPVIASAVKIKVKLNRKFSGGIYEWIVE
jgi:hypothetical protein